MKGFLKTFAVAALVLLAACRGDSPAERMRAVAPRAGRTIEARLTGFGWSPMRVQRSTRAAAPLEPARLELAGAAGAVIEKTPGGHDAGVGYLVIDRDADAVESLQEAAQKSPNDAKVWSDLAAARYTLAVREDKPYELPRALAAADRALRINTSLPDALFNRALIIERLGITEAARRAWQRYLQADGTSKWADEALQHLGRLDVVATRAQFERDLGRARTALHGGDTAPIAALTRSFPQEARTWGEGPLLAEWADGVQAGNDARAAEALAVVREIARALVETNHEQLLSDTVASIDAADPAQRRTLAMAHDLYRKGRILYSQRKVAESDEYLRRSAMLFAQAKSPMQHWAECYVAHSAYDSNRAAEARTLLLAVAARIEGRGYRALLAKIQWELSLAEQLAGSWGTSIRYADDASRTFASLGEATNRANVDLLLADALDRSGQSRAAWITRPAAFRALSAAGDDQRIAMYLAPVVRATARSHDDAALALADVSVDELLRQRDPHAVALTHVNRARLLAESGSSPLARQALAEARTAAKEIPDPALRARMSVLVDIAAGMVERDDNPQRALAYFNDAVAFVTRNEDHAGLADTYLQRGQTFARMDDDAAALADFESGLRELDAQRALLASEQRSGFYDTEPDLFAETIALHLRRGRMANAFALADGARARSLYEQLGTTTAPESGGKLEELRAVLPPRTALIEYALLNDAVAIFYVTRDAAGVEVVKTDDAALRRLAEHFGDLLQRRGDMALIEKDAAALHHSLIAPVAPHIASATELVIVPDRELHAIPFAALYDAAKRRWLLEDFTIRVSPSAAFLRHPVPPLSLSPALVVGDPKSDGGPALPDAAREAEAIAGMYGAATLLTSDRATRERFIEAAQRSGVIHYSGHAQSDADTTYGTLRLAPGGNGDSGALDASAIARLRLRAAPLVILGACGTIRGEANHVEGMPSLARAFLAAGARSVIGTLWEIDDDTASRLFRRVHQELRAGQTPAAALRRAQMDLARDPDPRLRHPSTWAPVEILGNAN
jgi:CHAT domain-containing protein